MMRCTSPHIMGSTGGINNMARYRGHSTPVTGHGVLVVLTFYVVGLDMHNMVSDIIHTV